MLRVLHLGMQVPCESKISNFQHSAGVRCGEQQVLRLEVTLQCIAWREGGMGVGGQAWGAGYGSTVAHTDTGENDAHRLSGASGRQETRQLPCAHTHTAAAGKAGPSPLP